MENDDTYQNYIKTNFTPNCLVFSTESAKKIIAKNNLTPAEFLRPFGFIPKFDFHSNIFFTTITSFQLDFYDTEQFKKIPLKNYSKIIENNLTSETNLPEINQNEIYDKHISKTKLSQKVIDKLLSFSFPWFGKYISAINELLRFNEYELFQQPLCYIYFCALNDSLDIIKPKLTEKNKIPQLIYERKFDPDMPTLIIILNDKSPDAEIIDSDMRNKYIEGFKQKFKLYYLLYWEVNEPFEEQEKINEIFKNYKGDIWSKYQHVTEKYYYNNLNNNNNIIKGKFLSLLHRKNYHEMFINFFVKYAVKEIEKKIRPIDKHISDTKKGIKNAFWGFFKQDSSYENQNNNNNLTYSLNENEFQEYFLSIIYFFFQNYEQCQEISNYFMNDIKKKSIGYYNAAYELNKIAHFMCNNQKNPQMTYKDDAFESFTNYIKNKNYYHALRSLYFGIKVHEQNLIIGQLPLILSNVVSFIPDEDNKNNENSIVLALPILFEQIAIYYIVLEPMRMRKFFLFMILASFEYRQKKELFNKYTLNDLLFMKTFLEYKNEDSFIISKDFISEKIASICKDLKLYDMSLYFYRGNIENFTHYEIDKSTIREKNLRRNYNNLINILIEIKNDPNENNNNINDYLDNFKIPYIDNKSLLIIEEQDYIIMKQGQNKNWINFDKYDYVPVKKIFLCLTPPDIFALKNLDNLVQNKQNFSNFFSKRQFHINVKNKIFVRFNITNPLPIDINITNMKLICEFENEVIALENNEINPNIEIQKDNSSILYGELNLTLSKFSSQNLELYIEAFKEGKINIKGVDIILENIINIKHYFNKKQKTCLYRHYKKIKNKRRKSSSNSPPFSRKESNHSKGRRNSNISMGSSVSRSSSNSYLFHYNYNEEIICDIIDNNNDINIIFPLGTEINNIYKNQLIFMPIVIINKSNIKIKSFCFYFDDDNKNDNSYLLNNVIFKEIEIGNEKNNNEKKIYVPLIPKKIGEIYIKIVFKFEEDKTYIDHEIQRFLIKLNVKDSFGIDIKETINKYQTDNIDFLFENIYTIDNNNTNLTNINFNNIYLNNKIYPVNNCIECNSNINLNEEQTCIYKKYNINRKIEENEFYNSESEYSIKLKNEKLNKTTKEIETNVNFNFIDKYGCLKDEDMEKKFAINRLCRLLAKDYLIFSWNALEKDSNKEINGLIFHRPNINLPTNTDKFIRKILNNSISMSFDINKIENRNNTSHSICTLNVDIDKNIFNQMIFIKDIEIYINNDSNRNLKSISWLGLKRYYLINKRNKINENSTVEKLKFNCLITKKGIYDLNQISILIHSNIPRQREKVINKILSPIKIIIE